MAGFSSGDSSFNVKISDSATSKLGKRVQLRFSIGLNIRDKALIHYLVTYFNLGSDISSASYAKNIYLGNNSISLQVVNYSDIITKIIPFFDKYPIQGKKSLDFLEFKNIAFMISNKEHLTSEGFNKILDIKAKMNE